MKKLILLTILPFVMLVAGCTTTAQVADIMPADLSVDQLRPTFVKPTLNFEGTIPAECVTRDANVAKIVGSIYRHGTELDKVINRYEAQMAAIRAWAAATEIKRSRY